LAERLFGWEPLVLASRWYKGIFPVKQSNKQNGELDKQHCTLPPNCPRFEKAEK